MLVGFTSTYTNQNLTNWIDTKNHGLENVFPFKYGYVGHLAGGSISKEAWFTWRPGKKSMDQFFPTRGRSSKQNIQSESHLSVVVTQRPFLLTWTSGKFLLLWWLFQRKRRIQGKAPTTSIDTAIHQYRLDLPSQDSSQHQDSYIGNPEGKTFCHAGNPRVGG